MNYSPLLLRQMQLSIGRNIRSVRTQQKFTLKKLSRLSGVPERVLDRYEMGKADITLEDLLRVSCVLDADISEMTLV